ncbi:hypothetical protein A2U01_0020451, partial [Trifolium medium]|nr:hypothetical protein [Trifolium medium]
FKDKIANLSSERGERPQRKRSMCGGCKLTKTSMMEDTEIVCGVNGSHSAGASDDGYCNA